MTRVATLVCALLVVAVSAVDRAHQQNRLKALKSLMGKSGKSKTESSAQAMAQLQVETLMQNQLGVEVSSTTKKANIRIPLKHVPRSHEEDDAFFQALNTHHAKLLKRSKRDVEKEARADQIQNTLEQVQVSNYKLHLEDINNSQFVGEISVGNPGQTFGVIFDTGSSNLWITGRACEDEPCRKHRQFDPEQSNTFKQLDMDMDVQFGTGSISGSLAEDTFAFGPVRVLHQTFGMITSEDGEVFNTGKFDGILGLSFPALSASDYTPVFDNIMAQHLLAENMFSFFYTRLPEQGSAIEFGVPSNDLYQNELTFVEVKRELYWELEMKDIFIGDKAQNVCAGGPCKIVVDTGTSLLTGPSSHISSLLKNIGVTKDCVNFSQLPVLTYVLQDKKGEYSFTVEPEFYVVQSDSLDGDGNSRYCKPGFMALDVPPDRGPLWILGDIFMQKYFTVFSRGTAAMEPSVGFAVSKHGPGDSELQSDENVSKRDSSSLESKVGLFDTHADNQSVELSNDDSEAEFTLEDDIDEFGTDPMSQEAEYMNVELNDDIKHDADANANAYVDTVADFWAGDSAADSPAADDTTSAEFRLASKAEAKSAEPIEDHTHESLVEKAEVDLELLPIMGMGLEQNARTTFTRFTGVSKDAYNDEKLKIAAPLNKKVLLEEGELVKKSKKKKSKKN